MTTSQSRSLVILDDLGPGMVPTGWSEKVLARGLECGDAVSLWHDALKLGSLAQQWNGHGKEKTEIKCAQMFCEILLGEQLGPRPGWGNQHGSLSHAISSVEGLIPQPRISELQRMYGWRDALVEAVRNGARSRRSLLLLVDQWEAADRVAEHGEPTIEGLDIRGGDFRSVLADVEPGSVTLILTDPPYPVEYLPLWDDLGAWAAESLVEGGSLVAYCGQSILPEALDRLRPHLRYWWQLIVIHGQSQMIPGKWVSAGYKPLLWFVRERRATRSMQPDTIKGSAPRKTVATGDDGSWAQGVDELESIISGLTAPGDLIVDPFAGSGTVGIAAQRFGRRFIGAEVTG